MSFGVARLLGRLGALMCLALAACAGPKPPDSIAPPVEKSSRGGGVFTASVKFAAVTDSTDQYSKVTVTLHWDAAREIAPYRYEKGAVYWVDHAGGRKRTKIGDLAFENGMPKSGDSDAMFDNKYRDLGGVYGIYVVLVSAGNGSEPRKTFIYPSSEVRAPPLNVGREHHHQLTDAYEYEG
jgi:hypothetical protein